MVHPIAKLIVPPIYQLWLRKIEGLENIPKDCPFIIAANHTSYYETVLLHTILIPRINKEVHALCNSYYWKYPIARYFLNLSQTIPVYVEESVKSKSKNKKSFDKALYYLKKKEIVLIFPEGKRGDGKKLNRAYNGVAKLAINSKAPVLPVGIVDAHKVLPKGKLVPRFKKAEVRFGKQMKFEKFYNKKINDKILNQVTREIMKQVGKLIGQKYNY